MGRSRPAAAGAALHLGRYGPTTRRQPRRQRRPGRSHLARSTGLRQRVGSAHRHLNGFTVIEIGEPRGERLGDRVVGPSARLISDKQPPFRKILDTSRHLPNDTAPIPNSSATFEPELLRRRTLRHPCLPGPHLVRARHRTAWVRIDYTPNGEAHVADCTYTETVTKRGRADVRPGGRAGCRARDLDLGARTA